MTSQSPSSGPLTNLPSSFIAEDDAVMVRDILLVSWAQLSRLCPHLTSCAPPAYAQVV